MADLQDIGSSRAYLKIKENNPDKTLPVCYYLYSFGFKGVKNIGPTIAQRLTEIGIYTLADLQDIGSSRAYLKIKENNPDKPLPVCYYLYSFEGALLNLHWAAILEKRKKELVKAIGK